MFVGVCYSSRLRIEWLLNTSRSLHYVGTSRYNDGGSIGFVFTNQNSRVFTLFVWSPNYGEGIVEIDGKKIQRILLILVKEFREDQTLELRVGSRQEARVIKLVQTALQDDLPDEQREEIYTLLEVLKERTFDWRALDASHGYIPRAKGRPPR